jgi:AcrR family transcriptional regulator
MNESRRDYYHHGALRQALLDSALQLVTEQGVQAVTLREVARLAGVSHNAPYHHFADKAALIEALAAECFTALAVALQSAIDRTSGSARDKFLASGGAYVGFAYQNQAVFRLMFRPELRRSALALDSPEAAGAALLSCVGAAHDVLIRSIVACQAEGSLPAGEPATYALAAWSTVHGLATLLLDGVAVSAGSRLDNLTAERLARQISQLLMDGLASGVVSDGPIPALEGRHEP